MSDQVTDYYSDAQRQLQDRFDTRRLADTIATGLIHGQLQPHEVAFVENSDMVFVSTVNQDGQPTVSYKGGDIGFVKVMDASTLIFPVYDGNGTFYSFGNVAETSKIGLLFIDFEHPNRMRIHGTAELLFDSPLMVHYHEAKFLVRVTIAEIYPNCPRYVHKYQRLAKSKYVPDVFKQTPFPAWKRIDEIQDKLPVNQQGLAGDHGGEITLEQYGEMIQRGEI